MRLSKARRKGSAETEITKQAVYENILTDTIPVRRTWSARMPAYCFTVLCPDGRYRPGREGYIKWRRK